MGPSISGGDLLDRSFSDVKGERTAEFFVGIADVSLERKLRRDDGDSGRFR